jgi:hypothetical protein
MPANGSALPDISRLHERHFGLTVSVSGGFAEALATILDRRHSPPAPLRYRHVTEARDETYTLAWVPGDHRTRAAWANDTEATEAAACGVALAVVETDLGLFAVSRVRQGGGADYWVAPAGTEVNPGDGELDFEGATRLEVSGIETCPSEAALLNRLAKKVEQVKSGGADEGLAAVVAFNMLAISLRLA